MGRKWIVVIDIKRIGWDEHWQSDWGCKRSPVKDVIADFRCTRVRAVSWKFTNEVQIRWEKWQRPAQVWNPGKDKATNHELFNSAKGSFQVLNHCQTTVASHQDSNLAFCQLTRWDLRWQTEESRSWCLESEEKWTVVRAKRVNNES